MRLLEAEESEIDAEQDALRKETENVKAHNKALFEKISSNQQSMVMQDILTSPSIMEQTSHIESDLAASRE
jgi:hypothetical protein